MDAKALLWFGVLGILTGAYAVALSGARAAKAHDVRHHGRRMIVAATIVCLWLVAYVTKQLLFGRERFGGTERQYWTLYVPIFTAHMVLAITTVALGAYNLYTGLRRVCYGSVGAMSGHLSRHRRVGRVLLGSFTGTMITAYAVYLLLLVFFPG